jgi:glycosyltransferase involved in cell wall biosynthesis
MKFVLDFENAELIGDLNTNIRVCVLVNTYNHEKYIEECLLSIIVQETTFPFKIIVHDDNSTDGTQKILLEYQEKFPEKISLILEKQNQWELGNSNLAMLLTWIESDFVSLCEGDDYWNSKDKMAIQEKILTDNSDISLSYHAVDIQNQLDNDNYAKQLLNRLNIKRSSSPELQLGQFNFIMTGSVMFRNRVIKQSYLAGIHALVPVDWLLFAALAEGGKINYLATKLSTYRIHIGGAWSTANREIRQVKSKQVHWYIAGALKGDVGAEARKSLQDRNVFSFLRVFKFLCRLGRHTYGSLRLR